VRTHSEIIEDAGGWRLVRDGLKMPADDAKVKFWFFRDSIPGEWWVAMANAFDTTVDELALHAHRRRYLRERGTLLPKPQPSAHKRKPGRPRKSPSD
jgi:hypothetical protein